jgi:integrase
MSIHRRRLASGRMTYQVRLRTPDGDQLKRTFRTLKEAERFIVEDRAARLQGTWIDLNAGKVHLDEFARLWLEERTNLRPRTIELYEYLLRLHIFPGLGNTRLEKLTPMMIRSWHSRLHSEHGVSPTTAAKAYRLLRSILGTATDDKLIAQNPCMLRGAGVERHAERPVLTTEQVASLADAIHPKYRAMVLLATWAGLRFGEAAGLKQCDVDLSAEIVRVERQLQELKGGKLIEGPPKTHAGRRLISLPPHVVPELRQHLGLYVDSDPSSLVFTSPDGTPLRRSNFNRRVWQPACAAIGLVGFRFHDLRHTGNTFAATTGASTKELMARMGHSSSRAALIYQHATRDRDRALADALSRLAANPEGPRANLRLVVSAETECAPNAPLPRLVPLLSASTKDESPDQTGGDDGTRTHDPLLAKQVL